MRLEEQFKIRTRSYPSYLRLWPLTDFSITSKHTCETKVYMQLIHIGVRHRSIPFYKEIYLNKAFIQQAHVGLIQSLYYISYETYISRSKFETYIFYLSRLTFQAQTFSTFLWFTLFLPYVIKTQQIKSSVLYHSLLMNFMAAFIVLMSLPCFSF